MTNTNTTYKPKAFISCSLRTEDKNFVDLVENITRHLGFAPYGTVGRHSIAPKPLWEQMRDGVRNADCIIIAMTPRYLQQDVHDKKQTGKSISEMLHFELGMAVYKGIPIIAIASDDKVIGKLVPTLTSIVTINQNDQNDFYAKWPLLQSYFRNAMSLIVHNWDKAKKQELVKQSKDILAFIGGATIVYLFINALLSKKK